MPGRAYTALFGLATDRYGYVTQEDAADEDFTPQTLDAMVRRGVAERVGWGLYRFIAFPPNQLDQYMEATLWPRPARGVLSHETALDLHDLCDVNPKNVHVTVPKHYRTNRTVPELYVLHRRDLAKNEQILYEGIPIVTPARAILDAIEAHLRGDLIATAIETAQGRGLLRPAELRQIENTRA
jgi:predicted transcriptional regulator of viral defense system